MRNDRTSNPVLEKSFAFSLAIIEFSEQLVSQKRYRMADQIFRSGTCIGANIRESQNAESRNDFIHKLKVAAKEADETAYSSNCAIRPHIIPVTNICMLSFLKSLKFCPRLSVL